MKLKSENLELQETTSKLRQDLNGKKLEISALNKKIDELERLLNETQSTSSESELSPELFALLRELKSQAGVMEEFFKKKNFDSGWSQRHLQEIEEIRTERVQAVQKMREE